MAKKLTKDQLQKQLNDIANREHQIFIDKTYPKFKKLEGRYFKKRNSYGQGRDWWIYIKITKVKKEDIYRLADKSPTSYFSGWSFETCTNGGNYVKQFKYGYLHDKGQQISEKEFNDAWNKMVDGFEKLT